MSAFLEVCDLSVEIGGLTALRDVSISVDRGECIGLVGETGSGKSLTCRAIIGMLSRIGARATAGRVMLDGVDLVTLDPRGWSTIRGYRIGFVPQASMAALDPVMRVGNQLRETISILDPAANREQRAIELLESVRLPDVGRVLRSYPHELSGGMRQRVMIALALAGGAPLLVADEPTTALDVTVQREILDLLDSLRRDLGMALVLVTHDLAVIGDRADRVAVMYAGSVVEQGPVAEVLGAPVHPYTKALLAARPFGAEPGSRLASIAGLPPALGAHPAGCAFAPRCAHAQTACEEAAPAVVQVSAQHSTRCIRWRELS